MVRVYISASVETKNSDKELVAAYIRKTMAPTPVLVKYWGDSQIYNPEYIKNADVLVVMDEKNSWRHEIKSLPIGVKREYLHHFNSKKKVLTAYRNLTDGWKIYNSKYDILSDTLNSISNSKHEVVKTFKDIDFSKITSPISNYSAAPTSLGIQASSHSSNLERPWSNLTKELSLELNNPCSEILLPKQDDVMECCANELRRYSLLLVC